MSSRREAVRLSTFTRARLIGQDRSLRCAVVNLSAGGALVTLAAELPCAPLELEFTIAGQTVRLPVTVQRRSPGGLALAFPAPPSEMMFHLIATEQRLARSREQETPPPTAG